MGNCLVTKLKGTVDNSSLPVLNELLLTVVKNENSDEMSNLFLKTKEGEWQTISVVGDGYMMINKDTSTTYQTININGASHLRCSNGNYKLSIKNKYYTTGIGDKYGESTVSNIVINLADFEYLDMKEIQLMAPFNNSGMNYSGTMEEIGRFINLEILYLWQGLGITGNLSSLSNLHSLKRVMLTNNGGYSGDVSVFGNNPSLEVLYTDSNSVITGSVENLVRTFIQNGRTVETETPIECNFYHSQVTFGNIPNFSQYGIVDMYWESANRIYLIGHSQTNLVFTLGYTQSEAETKWPGKTIIMAD